MLAGHSLVYGIGSALSAAAGFLLIPLYTGVLRTDEYGILELLNRTADIFMLVMFLGTRQAYIRFYFEKNDPEWEKKVTGTVVVFVLGAGVLISLLIYPLRGLFVNKLFKDPAADFFITLMLLWIPLEMVVNIGFAHLQIQMKSVLYVGINAVRLALVVVLNLIFVYIYRKGIAGIYFTNILVSGLLAFGFLIFFIRRGMFKISLPLLKELIKFGLPYLPASFFMFIINNSDRYVLSMYSSLNSLGIYALAIKIGMMGTMLLMEPFSKVWAPFLFENYKKDDGPKVISKVFLLFTLTNMSVALGIAVLSSVVIPYISGRAYHSSSAIIPLISLGSVFYSMACIADAGILISKKTQYKPFIFGICSVIAVALNLLLVPKYGAFGASVALSITFFSLFIINYTISNRFFAITIEGWKMFLIFMSSTVTYLISMFLIKFSATAGYMKVFSVFSIVCFPLILWLGGFFNDDEKEALRKLLIGKFS